MLRNNEKTLLVSVSLVILRVQNYFCDWTGRKKSIMTEHSKSLDGDDLTKWGLPLKHVYQLALKFFKDMEGKALNLTYEDKLKLVAFSKQVAFGKCNEGTLPQLGVLDVIGRNRRLAWKELDDMKAEEAMTNFIDLLNFKCFLFKPYIDAHVADIMSAVKNDQPVHEEKKNKTLESEEDTGKEEIKRRLIQDALNQQTYSQFRAYAEEQYPGNPERQAVLVRQLQDEHYTQYMQQLIQHTVPPNPNLSTASSEEDITGIATANMWTLENIRFFKDNIRKEGGDAIIKISHGETVTVRVPTHEGGSCLYWEFCTDHYDLGFGIFFEWTKSPTNQVSVHVSETDDELVSEEEDEEEEEEEEEEDRIDSELEDYEDELDEGEENSQLFSKEVDKSGLHSRRTTKLVNRSPLSIISPVMRRDCHQEVYAGSHHYPGEGVYLLKFDNSYSLWRSKTLYYRVYYTR